MIKKRSFIILIICFFNTFLIGTKLYLPDGLGEKTSLETTTSIKITDTEHLYFPNNGSQLATKNASAWSLAKTKDDKITDWYVWVFGGNEAVALSKGKQPQSGLEVKMGFSSKKAPVHIITASEDIKQQFWKTFRIIAENPVGRVLLYRLLIEIRRQTNAGINCCGDDTFVTQGESDNYFRQNALTISVIDNINDGLSFILPTKENSAKIKIGTKEKSTYVLNYEGSILQLKSEVRSLDIGLFHEMIHWYHYLRDPVRFSKYSSKESENKFIFPLCCYYGNLVELNLIWSGQHTADSEEISTILGVPNPYEKSFLNMMLSDSFLTKKDKRGNDLPKEAQKRLINICGQNIFLAHHNTFLNGDDISENVYRVSKNQKLRYGHSAVSFMPIYCEKEKNFPFRFKLAKEVAYNTFEKIIK